MAYLLPSEFVTKMVDAGESKIFMSTRDTLIRAFMAGAILALDFEDSSSLLINQTGNTFDTSTTSKTTNGGFCDTLDVVTKNLSVALGTALSEALAALAACWRLTLVQGRGNRWWQSPMCKRVWCNE